jgi:tRNA modification GTPase
MLAALLTPPGRGAIAVVHVCGDGARALVAALFGKEIPPRPCAGRLTHRGEIVDEVMVRTAAGFTGEETVEITCHGGIASVDRVFEALALPRVEPEELLERGVETGHLDRLRAEAWTLLPGAPTELAARVFLDQSEGALSRAVAALAAPREAEALLSTAPLGLALASPRRVVLAGSPNVGKSTLFNALVESDRALVSPLPGTTRDPVRERIAIEQVPVELVDTAGVEEPRSLLEQLSIERTRQVLKTADVVLFLFDAEAGARGDELRFLEALSDRRVILLVNKVDVGSKKPLLEAHPVSARTRQGLDEVRRRILHALRLRPEYRTGAPVVFTPRQERLLVGLSRGALGLSEARDALLRGPARSE